MDNVITSRQNPKIKYAAKLQMKKYRDREGRFLVEGYYPIKFALESGYPIETVYVCPRLLRGKFDNQALLAELRVKNIPVTEISDAVYERISRYESPEGLIAIAPQKHALLASGKPKENGLFIVAESIEKASSLGMVIRLADNTGASGVILSDKRVDMFNPEVMRTSMGTFFTVPVFESTSSEIIKWLKDNKIDIVATSPAAEIDYTEADMTGPTAIVLGTEHGGLSETWLSSADKKVKIPMYGRASSLSVASSGAVMLYEAVRQRNS